MKIESLVKTNTQAIKIRTIEVDADKLRSCEAFTKAELEARIDPETEPRMIVHGVPVIYGTNEIKQQIITMNHLTSADNDINVKYVYKAKNNSRVTSAVIEVFPTVRHQLIELTEIYVGWSRCKIEDYVRIHQCFKCLRVGHSAKKYKEIQSF